MVPMGTSPTNPYPVCFIQDVSLTHPGWNGAYGKHLPQTHAQNSLYGMFLLHILAEMVPTGTPPTNQCPVCSLWDVSLTNPGWNGAYGNISHKPVPSMLYTGCFSYTSRLKWCLWRTSPTKPCIELSLWDVSLIHPGWNGAYRNSSHEPIPSMFCNGSFS